MLKCLGFLSLFFCFTQVPAQSSWTSRSSGTQAGLNSITWTGSQYIAVGNSGTVLSSSNGISWVSRASGVTQALNSVAWNGSQLMAVGDNGVILTSPDAVAWTLKSSGYQVGSLNAVIWAQGEW